MGQEHDDYGDQPGRKRRSPLLTLILIAAFVVAVFLAGYLALIALVQLLKPFPPK
jgi:uncharacterized protein involved in exopolysaccharide biosynthesis